MRPGATGAGRLRRPAPARLASTARPPTSCPTTRAPPFPRLHQDHDAALRLARLSGRHACADRRLRQHPLGRPHRRWHLSQVPAAHGACQLLATSHPSRIRLSPSVPPHRAAAWLASTAAPPLSQRAPPPAASRPQVPAKVTSVSTEGFTAEMLFFQPPSSLVPRDFDYLFDDPDWERLEIGEMSERQRLKCVPLRAAVPTLLPLHALAHTHTHTHTRRPAEPGEAANGMGAIIRRYLSIIYLSIYPSSIHSTSKYSRVELSTGCNHQPTGSRFNV